MPVWARQHNPCCKNGWNNFSFPDDDDGNKDYRSQGASEKQTTTAD